MERFLSQCAEYIHRKHAGEMQDICLVFPNRRAGVFFTAYLQKQIQGAEIGPAVTTVNELFSGFSEYFPCERLQLISLLYDVIKAHTQTSETFDEFYFWGEILLADFNDIDRYLVNAEDLFRNIADIREIESLFDYLTPEQKEALEHFWGSVAVAGNKEFQKKYVNIWEKLYPVYADFKKRLAENQLAYGGMSDRAVAERLKSEGLAFPFRKYVIIGLNALNACEKELFTHLQRKKMADFLWDYDRFYLDDLQHEAGRFMRENLKQFPPPGDFGCNNHSFEKKKNIQLVAVSSVFGQAQAIPVFLNENQPDFRKEFDNTAVVLADETLLYPALGAIPEDIGTVNVTMGYPVKNSVVYGFLLLLLNLLKNKKTDPENRAVAYHRFVTDVLNHPLFSQVEPEKTKVFLAEVKQKNRVTIPLGEIDFSALHQTVFFLPENVNEYSDYFLSVLEGFYRWIELNDIENKMLPEIIYSVYQAVEKLKAVVLAVTGDVGRKISPAVYFRLFHQYLAKVSVAFEGEPLSGVQVMGILETRCLDFENLVILGLNENKWPRTFVAPSFIAHNIRKGFGLPGIDEQDAMYAYYFYRLIQRAQNVTATYSVVKDGISTGELSRYGFQLLYDSAHTPQTVNLGFSFANDPVQPIEIKSSPEKVADFLSRITEKYPLSPSAVNIYLQCSLRFYFRYFLQLPEPGEVKDEIDSPAFGNIFHETVESLYRPFVGKVMEKPVLEKMRDNKILLENEIRKAIAKHYFMEPDPGKKPVPLEGKTLLIFENIKTFLEQLLNIDADCAPVSLVSLENHYRTPLTVLLDGTEKMVWLGGKIDRVDRVNGRLRILDYKTGDVASLSFKSVDDLFQRDQKTPPKEILQALLYTFVLSRTFTDETGIQPVIYSLRRFFTENYSPEIQWDKKDFSFAELEEEFREYLVQLVQEILSPETVFYPTPFEEKCRYCPYRKICRRY
jgi:CRISPR/Cas system-associated exonuclease Cas4 (RecB family)